MTVYFISGSGADEQVFRKLSLPKSWNIKHLSWIEPLPDESLSSYSYRLSAGINTGEDFILIGLSFGGIIAIKLSRIVTPKLTILISSIATKSELPAVAHFFAKTKLDGFIPAWLLKMPNPILYCFFGVKTSEEKKIGKAVD